MKTKHIIIGVIAVVAIYFLFFRGKKKEEEEKEAEALPPVGTDDKSVVKRSHAEFDEIFADKELTNMCSWMAHKDTGRSFCIIDGKEVYYDEIRGRKK